MTTELPAISPPGELEYANACLQVLTQQRDALANEVARLRVDLHFLSQRVAENPSAPAAP